MTIAWNLIDDPADRRAAWAEVVAECGYATYFQTPDWSDGMAQALGTWTPAPVAMEFADGNLAVLPLVKRVDSPHHESVFPGMYGGPLFRRPPTDAHWDELDRVPLWYEDAFFVENPYAPFRWMPNGLVGWRLYTHRTDLSVGFDALWRSFRTNLRRSFAKSEDADMSVRLATTRGDRSAYYDIYAEAIPRFGEILQSY